MKIFNLEQNAISTLAKHGNEPFWRDLREQLLAGVRAGKFLCPVPKETIVETIPCSRDVRIKIRDLQQELSLGFSFKSFGPIEGEETLALVRPSEQKSPFERIIWHSVEDDELAAAKEVEFRAGQDGMRRRMDAFIALPDQSRLTVGELRNGIIAERAGSLFRQIERRFLISRLIQMTSFN